MASSSVNTIKRGQSDQTVTSDASTSRFRKPLSVGKSLDLESKPAGIQGANNSCYLDTMLFAMFGMNDSFDYILTSAMESENKLAHTIRETLIEFVNDLRKDGFVKSRKKQVLRKIVNDFFSQPEHDLFWTGLEKDPVDFIDALFGNILKISPAFRSGELVSPNVWVITPKLGDTNRRYIYANYQNIFSNEPNNFKLNQIPKNLILKIPNSEESFAKYTVPSPILDISNRLDLEPKQCCICGLQATITCLKCFGIFNENLNSVYFCQTCATKCHNAVTENCDSHIEESLIVSDNSHRSWKVPMRVVMHLHAVICFHDNHYTCFVKREADKSGKWLYYNSMNGKDNPDECILTITPIDNFNEFISIPGSDTILQTVHIEMDKNNFPPCLQNEGNLDGQVDKLFRNATIAFYNHPEKIYT